MDNSDIPTVLHVEGCTITVTTDTLMWSKDNTEIEVTFIKVKPDEGWDLLGMETTKVIRRE